MGINTGHVQTTDFLLEEADREFVVEVVVEDLCHCIRDFLIANYLVPNFARKRDYWLFKLSLYRLSCRRSLSCGLG